MDSICDSSRSSYTYFKAALISSSLTDLTSTSIASSAGEEAGDSHSARPTVPVKTTEVYCHFTSRYLVVAKYKWLMFRKVQAQFRLTPSTKVCLPWMKSLNGFSSCPCTSHDYQFYGLTSGFTRLRMNTKYVCHSLFKPHSNLDTNREEWTKCNLRSSDETRTQIQFIVTFNNCKITKLFSLL